MISPDAYFKEHELYDKTKLLQKAEHDLVRVIESERFPNVVMLHYQNECQYDNNWSTFSRMSRGLIVDLKNQKILAYPFEKFFNLDQMPETKYDVLNNLGPFEVSEKLDGSMLTLFQDPNTKHFHLTTKGSFDSKHGLYATSLLPIQLKSEIFVKEFTMMFELIDPKFRIVVDYKKKGYETGLYLIGMRHRQSNKLVSYKDVQLFAKELWVPTFKMFEFRSLDQIIETAKTLPVLDEGYVLYYRKNDLLVKIKGTEYLRVHRFISKLSPKHLLEVMMDDMEDEVYKLAPEEYRISVLEQINEYKRKKVEIVNMCYQKFSDAPKETRKDFALWVQANVQKPYQPLLFELMDNKPLINKRVYQTIMDIEKPSGETRI